MTIHTDLLQARDVGSAIVDEVLERGIDLVIVGIVFKKRFGGVRPGGHAAVRAEARAVSSLGLSSVHRRAVGRS